VQTSIGRLLRCSITIDNFRVGQIQKAVDLRRIPLVGCGAGRFRIRRGESARPPSWIGRGRQLNWFRRSKLLGKRCGILITGRPLEHQLGRQVRSARNNRGLVSLARGGTADSDWLFVYYTPSEN